MRPAADISKRRETGGLSGDEIEPCKGSGELGKMVEKGVRCERFRVDPGIAVTHQHERDPGGASSGGVVFVVADQRARLNAAAELADQAEEVTGIGLFDREAIASSDPVEQLD